jgi:hypothetical protein
VIDPRSVCIVCSGPILTGQPRIKSPSGDLHYYCRVPRRIDRKSPKQVEFEREMRMRQVHERNEKLRSSADIVIEYGEPPPNRIPADKTVYIESATAAMLRYRYGPAS